MELLLLELEERCTLLEVARGVPFAHHALDKIARSSFHEKRRLGARLGLKYFVRRSPALLALISVCLLSACYDSTWGQAKREQKRNAARLAPSALHAETDPAETPAKHRVLRVRFWITPEYSAQTLDPKRQIADMLEDANRVLEPALGIDLALQSFEPWTREGSSDDLNAMLVEIAKKDPGDDSDWVVGLVGNLPRATRSFHDAGYGEVLGKHIVMRAPNRLDELDMIEKSFDQLSVEDRTKLEKELKRHRAATIMLHELGHNLGALHEVARESIMSPRYDRREASFSPEAVQIMRLALEPRIDPHTSQADANRSIVDVLLQKDPGPWVPAEREQMLARLGHSLAASCAQPTSTPAASSSAQAFQGAQAPVVNELPDLTALAEPDREVYANAEKTFSSGDPHAAYSIAKPLFKKYPKSFVVADQRCRIAMSMSLAFVVAREECDAVVKLTADPSLKRKMP